MRQIQKETQETVVLGIQNEIYVQYIKVLDSQHVMRFHIPEGTVRYLTESSTGWMLLSSMPDDVAFRLLKKINAKMTDPTRRVDVKTSMERLAEIRKNKYCYIPDFPITNACAVSMLIEYAGGPFVIAAGGLVTRVEQSLPQMIKKMRNAIAAFHK
jgi:DNA-binding IclR family transcriptional regulator